MQKNTMGLLLGLVALMCGVALFGCSGSDAGSNSATGGASTTTTSTAGGAANVGANDTVEIQVGLQ